MSTRTAQIVRRTLPSAIGEPMIWLTGGALVLCLVMITLLAGMVVVSGLKTFWPKPIALVTLDSGEQFLGSRVDRDEETEGNAARVLYRVGNRDLGQESFRWVLDEDVVSLEYPEDAVIVEREAWGVWYGIPSAIETRVDGSSVLVSQGAQDTLNAFDRMHEGARARRAEAQRLRNEELGGVNRRIEDSRLRISSARVEYERASDRPSKMPVWVWGIALAAAIGAGFASSRLSDPSATPSGARVVLRRGLALLAAALAVALVVGFPRVSEPMTQTELDAVVLQETKLQGALQSEYDEILTRIRSVEAQDASERIHVRDPKTGRNAPIAQTQPDEPMLLSQVVRMVPPNALGFGEKVAVFLDRWSEFLTQNPREANTEGGVFPVIVGTVMLTLLLTIAVTPLGVIAALYLREYAKQGFVTSLIRIAVNNLAGVPSIVYGVFGLGFFCYTIGRYIDTGPGPEDAMGVASWWSVFAFCVASGIAAVASRVFSSPVPGKPRAARHAALRFVSNTMWGVFVVLVVLLIARTPYFFGFFEARASEGTPTFGSRGLLWASLTLALLTLPVVIVSTEEAISAVPDSMRQGSYGCGASKWQTMRRVVLPGALPGILTGAILAMARGAGEVAPLMLVGAVKLNQDLPFSGEAPFIHADRSFMHLGFHIYDLGFQSPDSQAARPLVWTTTLLFLTIVLALNLTAIIIRARIRGRMTGASV